MDRQQTSALLNIIDLLAVAAAFACAVWLLLAVCMPAPAPAPIAATAAASGVERPQYYAALLDGRVVIYLVGQFDPVLTTEIDVRTLPDADRAALDAGIPLDGMEAVQHLLEDYGS